MTRTQAKKLGLPLQRLVSLEKGRVTRRPETERNENLVYGLDGPQYMQRVMRKGRKPPIMKTHSQTGLPIRPLYIAATGKVLRAIPIDWEWGVDYDMVRKLDANLVK